MPAFAALVVAWDVGARRAAGFGAGLRGVVRSDAPWLPVWFAVVPAAVYVLSWTGWFATSYGFDRSGAALNGGHPASTIVAWLQYNKSMLGYGLGLQASQPYKSSPLGWPVLARPISFYSNCLPAGTNCGRVPTSTEQEVLAIGTPLIWWAAVALVLLARPPHRVLLLRGGVRPVPGDRDRTVPGPDTRPGLGRAEPPGGRCRGRRRLPARGRRQLLLPVSGPGRCDPPVHLLAGPHVVPQLDLTAAGPRGRFSCLTDPVADVAPSRSS